MKLKRYNKKHNYSYSFGLFPTTELIKNKKEKIQKVLFKEDGLCHDEIKNTLEICKKQSIPFEINDKVIDKIAFKDNTYVVGVFEKYKCNIEKQKDHLVLVNPTNTGNLGTIIRTMLAFDFDNLIIIRPGVDIFNPKSISSSMGSFFNIKYEYYDTFYEYFKLFPDHNICSFMLDGEESLKDIKREKNENYSLVFGNEKSGLDEEFNKYGKTIFIEHSKNVESLNLAISVGIVLYNLNLK